jgi:hypothetical protein
MVVPVVVYAHPAITIAFARIYSSMIYMHQQRDIYEYIDIKPAEFNH